MSYAIGIDIGGTKTAIGLVDETGVIQAQRSLPTDLNITPHEMVDVISNNVKALLAEQGVEESQLLGIGIGAPGPINTKTGHIITPPNLPSWWDFPIVQSFARHFTTPISFENDATAAALAEKWVGAGQHTENFVFITVSTGIGAGIYAHGKLLTGATGNAGDVGHFVIDPAGGQCVCGQFGCWEYLASGTAIARQASALLGREVSSKEAFDMAAAGNEPVKELVDNIFRYIGIGCVTLINTFDPEMIIIGGGVSQVGAPLFDAVKDYVSQYALNPSGRNTAIVPAALQQNAGLIGAAALVHMDY